MGYTFAIFVGSTIGILTVCLGSLLLWHYFFFPKHLPAALHLALVLQPAQGLNADFFIDVAIR